MIKILHSIPISRYHSRSLTSLWMGQRRLEVHVTTHFDWYIIHNPLELKHKSNYMDEVILMRVKLLADNITVQFYTRLPGLIKYSVCIIIVNNC